MAPKQSCHYCNTGEAFPRLLHYPYWIGEYVPCSAVAPQFTFSVFTHFFHFFTSSIAFRFSQQCNVQVETQDFLLLKQRCYNTANRDIAVSFPNSVTTPGPLRVTQHQTGHPTNRIPLLAQGKRLCLRVIKSSGCPDKKGCNIFAFFAI